MCIQVQHWGWLRLCSVLWLHLMPGMAHKVLYPCRESFEVKTLLMPLIWWVFQSDAPDIHKRKVLSDDKILEDIRRPRSAFRWYKKCLSPWTGCRTCSSLTKPPWVLWPTWSWPWEKMLPEVLTWTHWQACIPSIIQWACSNLKDRCCTRKLNSEKVRFYITCTVFCFPPVNR